MNGLMIRWNPWSAWMKSRSRCTPRCVLPRHPNCSAPEFVQVAVHLALQYPAVRTIHPVVDNLDIHRRKSLTDLLGEQIGNEVWDCFTVHYMSTHGSWLNQAEIEIGLISRQCLGWRRIPDLATLQRETRAWNRHMNRSRTRISWTFDRKAARRKFHYKRKSFSRSKARRLGRQSARFPL